MQIMCESADTVLDGFCRRSCSFHMWFVDFEIIQAAEGFKVVSLEFGNRKRHLCECGF